MNKCMYLLTKFPSQSRLKSRIKVTLNEVKLCNPKVKQSKGFGLSTNTKNKWATTPHITFNHEGGKNLFGKKSNKD